jgi:hypothetical protein
MLKILSVTIFKDCKAAILTLKMHTGRRVLYMRCWLSCFLYNIGGIPFFPGRLQWQFRQTSLF